MFYKFDEQKERDLLMTVEGQLGKPKEGITRPMLQAFFDRLNAWKTAKYSKYPVINRYVADYIDDVITMYSEVVVKPFGIVELHKPDQTNFMVFNSKQHKIAVQYIKTMSVKPLYWDMLEGVQNDEQR